MRSTVLARTRCLMIMANDASTPRFLRPSRNCRGASRMTKLKTRGYIDTCAQQVREQHTRATTHLFGARDTAGVGRHDHGRLAAETKRGKVRQRDDGRLEIVARRARTEKALRGVKNDAEQTM